MPKVTKKIKAKPKQSSKSIHSEQKSIEKIHTLKENLLIRRSLGEKLKIITDGIVDILDADFVRIWMVKKSDLCKKGCFHATVTEGPHVCRDRSKCLHLITSSGRYTHLDGGHKRVPLGCYKIGRVASGEDPYFVINDVTYDSRVHDNKWAADLGLRSFAGFRLLSAEGTPIGVLALFSKHEIGQDEERLLQDIANTTSQVILSGKTDESLRESEERLRDFLDNAGDLIQSVGKDGRFLYINRKWQEVLGYTAEEAKKMTNLEIVAKDKTQYCKDIFKRLEHGENIERAELTFISKDGREIYVQGSINAYFENGEFISTRCIFRDITEAKEAEDQLRESERRYRELYEGSIDGYAMVNMEGTIIESNAAFKEMLGYTDEELLEKTYEDITPSRWHSLEAKIIESQVMKRGFSEVYEKEYIRKDGTVFPITIRTYLQKDEAGNPQTM
jgi:PAS domain S-box-containing protein